MRARSIGVCALAALAAACALCESPGAPRALTAEQIVENNVQARGGLQAWRRIETMAWGGRIETGGPAAPALPFLLEFKRPNKTRFEILSERDKSVSVFDGALGWNVRTSSSGASVLRAYSRQQLRSARDAQGIDGPLIDHEAKGIKVALDGTDDVEGRPAYRLVVTLPSGAERRVWVDAQTFLETKSDRKSHRPGGRIVEVHYRNYRRFDGVLIPTMIESGPAGGAVTERQVIDDVTVNLTLSDARFERPTGLGRRDALRGWKQSRESP